jgi:hypothetical protein
MGIKGVYGYGVFNWKAKNAAPKAKASKMPKQKDKSGINLEARGKTGAKITRSQGKQKTPVQAPHTRIEPCCVLYSILPT